MCIVVSLAQLGYRGELRFSKSIPRKKENKEISDV